MEFATGALGTLLPKLARLLQDEYNLHKGVKRNIEFLQRELISIEAALFKVGSKPLEQLDEQVRIWAREAREVSYDMEDIVDTFLVRVQGTERPSKRSAKRFIKEIRGFVTKAKIQHDIGQEINKIKERVKEIAERRDRYKADAITPVKTVDVDPRIASLYTKAADLVGIDEAREELIMMLTKGDDISVQKQRIVSIVGFGGLGKTTLAKAVYDKLKEKYDCTAFVPVGRNPDLKKVLKDILIDLDKQYKNSRFETLDQRQLINESQGFLEKKRYFIVIDDVWDTNSLEIIKLALLENNNRSRIIITTRNHEVAEEAGEVYKLQQLSDDNSRKLFFGRISGGESKFSDQQLADEVSDKIIKKCEGIPLAIITMASLLAGKPWEEWSEVHRSIGFTNKENRQVENTKKIISFSYYDLPFHLRTCLLYLSVYPEDYSIKKSPLIWMWIAEGFVHAEQGISSFKIGEGHFNELINRSMIQLVEWEEGEKECSCHIHDMVLDLIRSISCEENFVTFLDNNNEGASSSEVRVRRLALQNIRDGEAHMKNVQQQVRSFISLGFDINKGPQLSSFKFIRVLAVYYIERCHMKHLRNLLHLRYLRVDGGLNVELPEEIGTLKFLQTLHVGGFLVGTLAKSVCFLTQQLLCLRLGSSVNVSFTDGISKLTSLEELHIGVGYHAGISKEEAVRRFMKELGSLRELRVLRFHCLYPSSMELQINLVESLRNLEKMEHLSLELKLDDIDASVDTAAWEEAGFLLPRRLRQLFLKRIRFSRFPSLCISSSRLPNLSHLSLRVDDIDEQDLRIIGGLPQLRFLQLDVKCTLEVACNTSNTDDESLEMDVPATANAAGDDGYLFKKLRLCSLWYEEVRLLPSKDGVPFRMKWVNASVLLGSEWEGVCSRGKGLVPTLMPRTQKLWFTVVSVREFKDENHGCCDNLCLEYFASLQNIRLRIYNSSGSDAEKGEVKAALQRGADLHPNRPRLHVEGYNM